MSKFKSLCLLYAKDHGTYICAALLAGWIFKKDIHQLIHNILTNQDLSSGIVGFILKILDALVTVIAITLTPQIRKFFSK